MALCLGGRVGAALIGGVRVPSAGIHPGQARRGQHRPTRRGSAPGTQVRSLKLRHRTHRRERAARVAQVVIHRHGYRSGASGMSTPPLIPPLGPSAPGLMSKSKISVGSQSVAQEFGMSTTPLMCPCTGAVPKIE